MAPRRKKVYPSYSFKQLGLLHKFGAANVKTHEHNDVTAYGNVTIKLRPDKSISTALTIWHYLHEAEVAI
jgi:hypothetical protein